MPSEFSVFSALLLLAAGQGIFLALTLIFFKKGNWQANRYLGVFTLSIAFVMVDYCIDITINNESALVLRALIWPRDYLYGAALYFYVREMALPSKHSLFPRQWLHFLPTLFLVAFFSSLPLLNEPLFRAILIDGDDLPVSLENLADTIISVLTITSILHVAIYLWLSIRILNRHRNRIKAVFSHKEKIVLNWLRYLLYGVLAVYLIWVFEELFSELVNLADSFHYLLGASLVVLVYSMSILGLRQPVIFTGRTAALDLKKSEALEKGEAKYKSSSLSVDLSQQLVEELQQLMKNDKPYLDSQLSLPQLAEKLGVSVNYLSQIINEQLNQNFFEFVNSYRVEEAKNIFNDTLRRKENILTVALESGFNAKSSFYTAFKKQTGLTPGAYRKQIK